MANLPLTDKSRVAVIGGGPAGSICAYFLLTFAHRIDLDLAVDIYEPRDFTQPGPGGCNMCGGIVSESLVQALAMEGIRLPPSIVQRGIDSYVLHTGRESVRIETPLKERRIAAVHRGGGPRDRQHLHWGGLDGYLLDLARSLGARVIPVRVSDLAWDEGRPQVRLPQGGATYDLLVGATGVNSSAWPLYERMGLRSRRPRTTKAYITEARLGYEEITRRLGAAMHVFLLPIPRLEFAAIIPKGEFATVCLLGQDIDRDLIQEFFASRAVRRCFPDADPPAEGICHCSPRINVREATRPYMDRLVLVGDCGVTRLYKDGIGAAYRTAKAAARTAIFSGVAAADFRRHYWPLYRAIALDNRVGMLIFHLVRVIRSVEMLRGGVLRMVAAEQRGRSRARPMSVVLWNLFTGSAPYRGVFLETLRPSFLGRWLWATAGLTPVGAKGEELGVEDA